MTRKDCENARHSAMGADGTLQRPAHARRASIAVCAWLVFSQSIALGAATARLWPTAVVVEDHIRVSDICELRGFDGDAEKRLASIVVTDSPSAGGSRLVHLDLVRSALTAAGANLAQVTMSGATQCAVSRPATPTPAVVPPSPSRNQPTLRSSEFALRRSRRDVAAEEASPATTLRQTVVEHFQSEFARYGGAADVVFDRTSDQVLDLSGPAYGFKVRRRGMQPLGLCPLEVDVVANGRTVQTVPLVVQVTMVRKAVVARRTINLDATVTPGDVNLSSLTFTRLDELGLDDTALAVGQRAKKVITAGMLIESEMLESVPLVVRGQLVTLRSVAGGVRVVTTGKAGSDGRLGEVVKVRSVDDKRVEFDAVVVGPGQVQLGARAESGGEPRLALGDRP